MANPIVCIESINNVRTSVQGNDPRTWMKACAIDTLLKGKSGKHFKNCLIGKMESTKEHIEDPAGYANELYNEIKGNCS
jgi:hypothetical protein|tara:strand:+ start:807 stop:1043 length:237 start_codon:yes stop_codon:yes gene_type:complete